jgi:hypothetical protein
MTGTFMKGSSPLFVPGVEHVALPPATPPAFARQGKKRLKDLREGGRAVGNDAGRGRREEEREGRREGGRKVEKEEGREGGRERGREDPRGGR